MGAPGATVLIALSAEERRLHFPEGWTAHLPDAALLEPVGMDAEAWRAALERGRPRVLISGWSTLPVPFEATVAGGGSLDYVCHAAGSVRHVVGRKLLEGGLKVTNWGALVAPVVAEHALLLILASLRNLGAWRTHLGQPLAARERKVTLGTRTLFGKRVGLFGFGGIARALIALLRPFRVSVAAWSPGVPEALLSEHGVAQAASLSALCAEVDVLVVCEALTESTRLALNADVLASLPHGAVLVNVGRGALVDETALVEAARANRLRLATDVATREPLSHDATLLQVPGGIVSPHIGGPTHDFFPHCGRHTLDNVARYLRGETPEGLITPEVYDRST